MTPEHDTRQLQTIERACEILDCLHAKGPMALSAIANDVGLTPGTVHTYLATLDNTGLVRKFDNKYTLGLKLIPYSECARGDVPLFIEAKGEVDKLSFEHDAVAHLSIEYEGKVLILYQSIGRGALGKEVLSKAKYGLNPHMHCTAAGKAILAHMPAERIADIIERTGLPRFTSSTITDAERLLEELSEVRERGYAVNNNEIIHGNCGVGASIVLDNGVPVGAISISGPQKLWGNEQFDNQLPESVMRASNNVEIRLHDLALGADGIV